jgi:hypothetical protein
MGKANGLAVDVGVERLMGLLPIRLGMSSHDVAYLFRDNIRDKQGQAVKRSVLLVPQSQAEKQLTKRG